MPFRAIIFALGVSLGLAQTTLSVEQLYSFINSSIRLKHADKQVASFLKNVKMTERLDDRTIEELQGLGAGPRTVEALRGLATASQTLPKATPKAVETPSSIPAPTPEERDRVLQEARANSEAYDKSLPDFICTQVTRRYEDPSGLEFWRLADTLTARLSYFEGKEDYKLVLVNNHMVTFDYERVGGTTTRGEFGTLLKKLFDPKSHTRFEWTRWATLRGKRMHVYAYRIAQPNSDFSIAYEHESMKPGYQGTIFVDHATRQIARLTIDVPETAPGFPIQSVAMVLDYDYADIAGQKYLLPLKAVARSRTGKMLAKNETEFRLYRKFAAEATVTFTPDALPDEQTQEQPPK
jgi:hypothetical protein